MATSTVKPELPALKTPLTAPLSATYPSELKSPAVGKTPTYIKREDAMKTPITPPAAYLDFLNKLSPTILSPQSAGVNTKFSLPEKPALTSNASSESIKTTTSTISTTSTSTAGPAEHSRPASPRSNPSRASSCSSESQKSDSTQTSRPPPVTIPSSSFARPISARTPRRLHIPQSPYSPASVRSPLSAASVSAASVYSPYSATMSPREWDPEKQGPLSSGPQRAVSVRQVVTRTVTYSSRTPIVEPVPANKKRKVGD